MITYTNLTGGSGGSLSIADLIDISVDTDEVITFDAVNNKFIGTDVFAKSGELTVATNTVFLGGAYAVASGGESVSIQNLPKNKFGRLVSHDFLQIGNPIIKVNRLSTGLVIPTPIDTDNITNPDYQQVISAFAVPAEDGHVLSFVDLNVDISSVTTNIRIDAHLNGVAFATSIYETLPPEIDPVATPNLRRFTFDNPIDVEVGDMFRTTITSVDGDVVLKGDTASGSPYQRVDVVAWDYRRTSVNDANGIGDYNDTSTTLTPVTLLPDTWTDVPNNGAGAFTNLVNLPDGVNKLMDTATGKFDFTELNIGDNCLIRNDFTVTPNTNRSILEMRYVLGTGAAQYTLETNMGRLDAGSGKPYRFSLTPQMIYIGDANTRDNLITLQIKLSRGGSFVNAGSAIGVTRR